MVAVVTYLPISLPGRQTVPSDTRRSDFFWWYWLVTSVILIYAIMLSCFFFSKTRNRITSLYDRFLVLIQ
jgi:hypothetical protein